MDISKEIKAIFNTIIGVVRHSNDPEVLHNIVHLTRNMLYILDEKKALDYKAAILLEYLEGVAPIVDEVEVNQLVATIKQSKDKIKLEQIIKSTQQMILHYFDPRALTPQIVVFWLDRHSTAQELKNMDTLMLFLTKEQQQKVLQMDKSLKHDPLITKIKQALASS